MEQHKKDLQSLLESLRTTNINVNINNVNSVNRINKSINKSLDELYQKNDEFDGKIINLKRNLIENNEFIEKSSIDIEELDNN